MRLENKVAMITGAGSGIGKETALLFAKEGARLVLTGRTGEKLEKVCKEIHENGGKAIYKIGNVSKREDMDDVVNMALNEFGKIDILINNAGINKDALITKMTKEQWNGVINVDLTGTFNCIQAVVDIMINQGNGVIINASSISGIYGNIGQANYASAKAGLIGLTRTLAKELGKKGVRVNAVAPGFTITPMTSKVPEKILTMMKEKIPLRTLAEPIDIAYAYLYLASDEARYVNGAVLSVDGGLVL
ncbi:MAG: beta-ketoacyl-ACP reductase [Candidatus Methanoperedens sp.]|nr:beta-ketoacyl-ACP reductase [Candidatus Methanoperedens sp.]MCZ7359038.1 beta-ketoacyl-ACP reductase [Candidatus Methanoperedens sp.]HKZ57719.1 beta-ketoacyl-ACP reductase [Thermodesulfovibrionales bacterium]